MSRFAMLVVGCVIGYVGSGYIDGLFGDKKEKEFDYETDLAKNKKQECAEG